MPLTAVESMQTDKEDWKEELAQQLVADPEFMALDEPNKIKVIQGISTRRKYGVPKTFNYDPQWPRSPLEGTEPNEFSKQELESMRREYPQGMRVSAKAEVLSSDDEWARLVNPPLRGELFGRVLNIHKPTGDLYLETQGPYRKPGAVRKRVRLAIPEGGLIEPSKAPEPVPEEKKVGRIGIREALERKKPEEYLPFLRGLFTLNRLDKVKEAMTRLKMYQEAGAWGEDLTYPQIQEYRDRVRTFVEDAQEVERRGLTIPGHTAAIVADMLPWALEFYMTAGLAGTLHKGMTVVQILRTIGKASAIRTAVTPFASLAAIKRREIAGESSASAHFKGIGEVYLAYASEMSGELLARGGSVLARAVAKRAPILGKFMGTLQGAWSRSGRTGQVIDTIMREGGFHGVSAELGEEYVEAIVGSVSGLHDISLWQAIYPGWRELAAMTAAFLVPGAPRAALHLLAPRGAATKGQLLSRAGIQAFIEANPELAERIAAKEQPSRADMQDIGRRGENWNEGERAQFAELVREAQKEQQDAERIRGEAEAAGPEEGAEGEAVPGVRVRGAERDRVAAEQREEVAPEAASTIQEEVSQHMEDLADHTERQQEAQGEAFSYQYEGEAPEAGPPARQPGEAPPVAPVGAKAPAPPTEAGTEAVGEPGAAVKQPWALTMEEYERALPIDEAFPTPLAEHGYITEGGDGVPLTITTPTGEVWVPTTTWGHTWYRDKPHRTVIEEAVAEGKPVPAEVLAKYPDLAEKAKRRFTPNAQQRVLAALTTEPKHLDELAKQTGMPSTETMNNLVMLEIKKQATQLPNRYFVLSETASERIAREAQERPELEERGAGLIPPGRRRPIRAADVIPDQMKVDDPEVEARIQAAHGLPAEAGPPARQPGEAPPTVETEAGALAVPQERPRIEMPELVSLAKSLLEGKLPFIVKKLQAARGRALGAFIAGAERIGLRADIFIGPTIDQVQAPANQAAQVEEERRAAIAEQYGITSEDIEVRRRKRQQGQVVELTFYRKDADFAGKVLAHEIGHVIDWLPDKTTARGNILGHIASLRKFIGEYLAPAPGAPGPLSADERARLRAQAEQLLREYSEIEIEEEIKHEFEVTPAEVLAIWNSTSADVKKTNPALWKYIAALPAAEKKQIVLQAMRGLVADEVARFKRIVKEKTGRVITRLVPGEEPTRQAVREKFQELFNDEVRKRQLFERRAVMQELKELTQWWNPFDPKQNRKYTAYRFKSTELYAEAISVLLNHPSAMRRRAPIFYKAFFNWLGSKQQVKQLYEQIQDDIRSGVSQQQLDKKLRTAFRKSHDRYLKGVKRAGAAKRVWTWFKTGVFSTHQIVTERARQLRRNDELEPERDPEYAIENALYGGAEREQYNNGIRHYVLAVLRQSDVSAEDFSEYLFQRRVVGERSTRANPWGYTAARSQERLDTMQEQMGEARFNAMERAREAFWQVRSQIVDKLRQSGMLSDELMEYIEKNEDYATFSVSKYADERYGTGVTPHIFPQIGTFEEIDDPLLATMAKDVGMISWANWNTAKRQTIDMLLQTGEAKEAERLKGDRPQFKEPTDRDQRLILFMDKGEIRGYHVPNWAALPFDRMDTRGMRMTATVMRGLGVPFRALFTVYNPGFWSFNLKRDYNRATKNLPKAARYNVFSKWWFGKYWGKAIKPAFKSAFDVPDASVDEMLAGNMLISLADPRGMKGEDLQLERELVSYHDTPQKWHTNVVKPFHWFFTQIMHTGEALERIPKIGGFMYLREKFPDMPMEEVAHRVRTQAGSPAFLVKARGTPILNNILLFSNPFIQGWRGDIEAARGTPAEYAWKHIKYTIVAKGIKWGLRVGAVTQVLKALGSGDDDKEVQWSEAMRYTYENISEYDMTNYTCIPLGLTPQGKTVYLRVPCDEGERAIGGAFYKLLNIKSEGLKSFPKVLEYGAGQFPTLNPLWDIGHGILEYLTGRNPYDTFRARPVLPNRLYTAQTAQTHREFMKWLANQAGASIIHRFQTDDIEHIKTQLEGLLGLPIVSNVVGRFIKVSDRGAVEAMNKIYEQERKERARVLNAVDDAIEKGIMGQERTSEERRLMRKERAYVKQALPAMKARREGTAYERVLRRAPSKKARRQARKFIRERESRRP